MYRNYHKGFLRSLALSCAAVLGGCSSYYAAQQPWMMDEVGAMPGQYMAERPRILPQIIPYQTRYSPGTIIIKTQERRLYFILPHGQAIMYAIGVGKPGFTWSGVKRVSRKQLWPNWSPSPQMIKRDPSLPRYMTGGIDNPLGAAAIYLGSSNYRIHGSREESTIGKAVSSGCFRMANEDIVDLYRRVKIGATVIVIQ